MKTKFIIGFAAIIAVVSVCFIACEKTSSPSSSPSLSSSSLPSSSPSNLTNSSKKGESYDFEIAYFDKESKEIKLTFDRDELEMKFSPIVDSLLGKDFVYEYISVVDDDVFGEKGDPALQISFFNIAEGASYNLFVFDINKKNKDGNIKYYMKALPGNNGNGGIGDWTIVSCKGTDCPDGCHKEGKNCSPCKKSDDPNVTPHCQKDEEHVLKVIIAPLTTLLAAIFGALIKK